MARYSPVERKQPKIPTQNFRDRSLSGIQIGRLGFHVALAREFLEQRSSSRAPFEEFGAGQPEGAGFGLGLVLSGVP